MEIVVLNRVQQILAQIIYKDVCHMEGVFYYGPISPSNADIESFLEMQGDDRVFNTLHGVLPLPLRSSNWEMNIV
jgi:hypothetical protein